MATKRQYGFRGDPMSVWFVEYVWQYFRDERGRFTRQPKRRKLPPFFRTVYAFEVRGVVEDVWQSEAFKVMCYVISTKPPKDLANRLRKFAFRVLNTQFYHWTHIYKEGLEVEQIGRNEISPAKLYRAYATIDDEEVGAADLY